MIPKFHSARVIDDCAAAPDNMVGNIGLGCLRGRLMGTKYQFDFDSNKRIIRCPFDGSAKILAICCGDPIRWSPRPNAPQLRKQIAPGLVVHWHRASAHPPLPKRDDLPQRIELRDEEIIFGILVEFVGD
jgi:hypothetical protein